MNTSLDADLLFLAIVLSLFLAVAVVLLSAGSRFRSPGASHLWTGWKTEFGIVAVILVPAYLGPWPFAAALLALAWAGAQELHGALVRIGLEPKRQLGVAGGTLVLLGAVLLDGAHFHTAVLVLGAALVPLLRRLSLRGAASTIFAILYPSTFLAYLLFLIRLDGGFGYVAFLLTVVEIHDSAALLVGSLVRGRVLWPRVSPLKTISGSLAGVVTSVAASASLAFLVPGFTMPQALLCGLVISAMAHVGDLSASAIKRRAGVKDFSKLVPSQGGVLDIYDALIFSAPFFYYYVQLVTGT